MERRGEFIRKTIRIAMVSIALLGLSGQLPVQAQTPGCIPEMALRADQMGNNNKIVDIEDLAVVASEMQSGEATIGDLAVAASCLDQKIGEESEPPIKELGDSKCPPPGTTVVGPTIFSPVYWGPGYNANNAQPVGNIPLGGAVITLNKDGEYKKDLGNGEEMCRITKTTNAPAGWKNATELQTPWWMKIKIF